MKLFSSIVNKDLHVSITETSEGYSVYVQGECVSSGIAKWKIDAIRKGNVDLEALTEKIFKNRSKALEYIHFELEKLNEEEFFYEEMTHQGGPELFSYYLDLVSKLEQKKEYIKTVLLSGGESLSSIKATVNEYSYAIQSEEKQIHKITKEIAKIEEQAKNKGISTNKVIELENEIKIVNHMLYIRNQYVYKTKKLINTSGVIDKELSKKVSFVEDEIENLQEQKKKLKEKYIERIGDLILG